MTEFPFLHFNKRKELKERMELLTYREFKKYIRTSEKYIRIENSKYRAELDREFCVGAEPRDFIEHVDTLMDAGQVLKKGDAIYVSHIIWNNKNIVVKRYDHKGFIHSLRHTIKRSRARKGWLYANFLGALGIATPKAPGYIEQRRGLLIWQSYLVTEYVEGQRLWHFLRDDDVTEQQKLEEIRQVVKLLDRLWDFHITHGDLKHMNVMVTQNGPVLIDLDGMIVHRWEPLYKNKQAKDMERFIRKTGISPALNNYCQLLISSRKDSCKKVQEGFEKMRIDNWIICIRKDFPKNYIGNIVSENYSSCENGELFTRVPSSDYTNVFKYSVSFDGIGHLFYLKKYFCRSRLDFAKHLFRPSRARRAFDASLMLQKNGFDTPSIIGLFEHHTGPFCIDNLLLAEEVKDSKTLAQLLSEMLQKSDKDTYIQRRLLIRAFGKTIGRMHAKGIFHGDLRLGNVLVVREEQEWRFFFIDNERTRQFRRLPDRLRVKNLVQINMFRDGITNTDRLRFLELYLKDNPAVAYNRREWIAKIITRTTRRLQNRRKYSGQTGLQPDKV